MDTGTLGNRGRRTQGRPPPRGVEGAPPGGWPGHRRTWHLEGPGAGAHLLKPLHLQHLGCLGALPPRGRDCHPQPASPSSPSFSSFPSSPTSLHAKVPLPHPPPPARYQVLGPTSTMTITIVGWSTRKRKDTAIVLQGDSFNCSPLNLAKGRHTGKKAP